MFAAFAAALAALALVATDANWDLELLVVLLVLAVASDLFEVEVRVQEDKPSLRISSGATAVVLAAVFLGATPAALIGIAATTGDSLRRGRIFGSADPATMRARRFDVLINLIGYTVFPLASAAVYTELSGAIGIRPEDPDFSLLVAATFVVAIAVNFATVAAYSSYIDRVPLRSLLTEAFVPTLPYEIVAMFAAVLVAQVYVDVGLAALVVLAVVMPVLQWLVRALHLERRRSAELKDSNAKLREAARTDLLTDLPNAQGMHERFSTELERSRLTGVAVSALIIDLDRFRSISETIGQEESDAVLRELAAQLNDGLRPIDTLGRTGPTEFMVLLPESDDGTAHLVAEQLLRRVRDYPHDLVALTASIGVASFPRHARSAEELLKHARRALDAAQSSGRDRIVVISPDVTGLLAPPTARPADSSAHLATLLALAEALNMRDTGTSEHSEQVARYAKLTAIELGFNAYQVERIRIAGMLHDIGKVGVPDEILSKAGPFGDGDWEEMRKHPEIAARILGTRELADIREWILASQERPDGEGYPRGLSGEEIPMASRIIAVANAYAEMLRERPWRPVFSEAMARREVKRNVGAQFDGEVVEALFRVLDREAANREDAA